MTLPRNRWKQWLRREAEALKVYVNEAQNQWQETIDPNRVMAIAVDPNGRVYLFNHCPVWDGEEWMSNDKFQFHRSWSALQSTARPGDLSPTLLFMNSELKWILDGDEEPQNGHDASWRIMTVLREQLREHNIDVPLITIATIAVAIKEEISQ
ncbi:hypothetical protein [Stenotrophomonas phage BUCT608]|nr:hypothetical protein [Stenotrophomonas phage BUCT608]QYC97445.1 hypothetical protein [Stenotrophomonas phage BUCT608]